MGFGTILFVSGLLILLGNMTIAILFSVSEKWSTLIALGIGVLMSCLIALFNFLTRPDHYLALSMGILAVVATIFFMKRPGKLAKLAVSSTILVGLSQIIFIR